MLCPNLPLNSPTPVTGGIKSKLGSHLAKMIREG